MTDPNPARKRTQSKSYREEGESLNGEAKICLGNADEYCNRYMADGNGFDLQLALLWTKKALKLIEMAMSRDTHSNELAGGTLA